MLSKQAFAADDEPIGLLAGALRRRIRELVSAKVARFDLTAQQFWVLVAVSELEAPKLVDVAARQRMDAPTASRVMKALASRGLVRDEGALEDRRRSCYVLTAAGRKLAARLLPVAAFVRGAVVEALTPAEARAVRRGLRKAIAHIDRLQADHQKAHGGTT
jgi:DNA-binding MarR family transcriptional regulator